MKSPGLNSTKYQEYLREKNGHPECPICASERWSFIEETDRESYALLKIDRNNPNISDDPSVVFLIMLVCRNCGFVAPVLRERVAEWVEGQSNG
jgi:rubredoxin